MKFRSGFVSNSSSSSYIVEVPKGFKVTPDELNNDSNLYEWEDFCDIEGCIDEDDNLTQQAADMINKELESLSNGRQYWRDGHYSDDIFWTLRSILEVKNMIIMSMDGPGGDGMDCIIPFKDARKK
jgi:hypothetical protein